MRHRFLFTVLFVLLAGYLLTGVAQVRPGERAVVRRFGRVLEHKPEPGLWVGLPWGMDRVDRVPVDLVRPVALGYDPTQDDGSLATPPGQLLTGDHNLVNVQVVLNYAVRPGEVEDYILQADRADELVARVAETVLAEWVAGRTVDEVLINGKSILPRWLVAQTQQRLQPYRLGVQIQDASIAHLLPPPEVKASFDEVTRAQSETLSRRYQAEQDAAQRVRAAEANRFRTVQKATAYVHDQGVLAEADATRFEKRLEQYQRLRADNPGYLSGIWWDEMGKLFGRMMKNGRIDLLDNHLGKDGLDITQFALPSKK